MRVGEVVPIQVLYPAIEKDINAPRVELPKAQDPKQEVNFTKEDALDTHYYYG